MTLINTDLSHELRLQRRRAERIEARILAAAIMSIALATFCGVALVAWRVAQ